MSNDKILTDDYVADLLSQEANDCSLKYSAMGMDAYRQNKKPENMLKPNTRFLRHIIKNTDNHNKALLAKEAAESRARLKDLEQAEEAKRQKTNPNARDIRRRQMGDIHAILGGKKRRRPEAEAEKPSSRESTSSDFKIRGSSSKGRDDTAEKSEADRDLFRDRRDERKHHGRLSREERHSRAEDKSRREDRRKARSRSRDASGDDEKRHHDRSRRHRSRSPGRRRRSHSPRVRKSRHRERSPIVRLKGTKERAEEEEDSDPIDDLIGPAPPPKYRGRGTFGGSSGIDRRFSETYDPKTDVQMDEDEATGGDNWDDAVEAFRDRQKLRQNQDERLKAAGFADDLIQRVNRSKQQAEEDVRWSKAGEKREWDRGKVVGPDGVVPTDEL
ncbi:Fc.00g036860.m01.CDS01 [Cosmosporella sp. VM-42]